MKDNEGKKEEKPKPVVVEQPKYYCGFCGSRDHDMSGCMIFIAACAC